MFESPMEFSIKGHPMFILEEAAYLGDIGSPFPGLSSGKRSYTGSLSASYMPTITSATI